MSTVTRVLSIQSSVAFGHVGNSAASFALMRMGIEALPVLTVHFSNHTGYGAWRGPMLAADDIAEVIRGIDERGELATVDAVLSGYQGAPDVGQTILDAVALVRERNPRALYCCDPVIGDVGRGIYVREGIPAFIRDRVLPAAHVATPNHFELDFLTGSTSTTLADVVRAAERLRGSGPEVVLVTSVVATDVDPGLSTMVVVTGSGAWQVSTPLLPRTFTGSGDLTAATFLARLLRGDDPGAALGATGSIVYSVLAATTESGQSELQLVAAQDDLVSPRFRVRAERL